jgi:hypothetical protein
MKCRAARDLFQGRIDEGLSFEEGRGLDLHLGACPECDLAFRKLARTVDLLRDQPEIEPSPTFLQDVLRRARQSAADVEPDLLQSSRVRRWIDALHLPSFELSRPWSIAYVALGLAIGVGGSSLLTQRWIDSRAPSTAPAVSSTATDTEGGTPMPSGPFEDLVKEMMARAETTAPGASEDTTAAGAPDWGSDWSGPAGARDRQVQASPTARGGAGNGGGAYVVF